MKRRFYSLFLVLVLIFSIFFSGTALAQEQNDLTQTVSTQINISDWALDDLFFGDTYDIYPQRWYEAGMQKPITNAQLRVLMAGIRCKLLNTGCVTEVDDVIYKIKDNMTVKEVLEILYTMIKNTEFNKDIGIVAGENALDYMAKTGIFTGYEGELSLKDICTIEQACAIATRLVTYLYDVLEASSKGFLWEIKSGENTAYLLGSIHVGNYDLYPLSNKILKAFAESDVLCVEIDFVNTDVNMMTSLYMQYAYYTDGTTLKDHVSEETYQKAVMVGSSLGLPEETIALLKPWYLSSVFSAYARTTSNIYIDLGIDMRFLLDAYLKGKPVLELEGYEFQFNVLDSYSDELDEYLLLGTLDLLTENNPENNTYGKEVNLLLKYWHDGDEESIKENMPILLYSDFPQNISEEEKQVYALLEEYKNKMFTQRDKRMAGLIDELLNAEGSTTYFIMVGAGHYISDYSVIDMLKEMGYEINRIK